MADKDKLVSVRENYLNSIIEENRRLRQALEAVEWLWLSSTGWSEAGKKCPWCLHYHDMNGHAPDCLHQIALGLNKKG